MLREEAGRIKQEFNQRNVRHLPPPDLYNADGNIPFQFQEEEKCHTNSRITFMNFCVLHQSSPKPYNSKLVHVASDMESALDHLTNLRVSLSPMCDFVSNPVGLRTAHHFLTCG